jgi:hypothetical protein
MQKYLRLLNLRLDVVVKDVCGLTGLQIIEAICRGETNPQVLASYCHGNCHKSKEEIAKALRSNDRKDYLFGLQQEFDLYQTLQAKINECDVAIAKLLSEQISADETKRALQAEAKPHKKVNKNAPKNMDLNQLAYQYFDAVDLMRIEGVSHGTVIALMSEISCEGIKKFSSAKQFTSGLRLCPNTKISGGKVLSKKIAKGTNRLKIALR